MAPKKKSAGKKSSPKKASAPKKAQESEKSEVVSSGKNFVVPSFPMVVYNRHTGQMRTIVDEKEYNSLGGDWHDSAEKAASANSPRLSGEAKAEVDRKDALQREQQARDAVRAGALPAGSPEANLAPVIASPASGVRPEPSASGSRPPERKAEPKAGKAKAAAYSSKASAKASGKSAAKASAKSAKKK